MRVMARCGWQMRASCAVASCQKGPTRMAQSTSAPPEVLFFEEEDFEDEMRETEGVIECLDGKRLTPFPKFAERMTSFSTSQS